MPLATAEPDPIERDHAVSEALAATVPLHRELAALDRMHLGSDDAQRVSKAREALTMLIDQLRGIGAVLLVCLSLVACGGESEPDPCGAYVTCVVDVLVGCSDPSFGPSCVELSVGPACDELRAECEAR